MQHVFIIGSRGLPAKYGGFETFVEELIRHQCSSGIKYHVACQEGNSDLSHQADRFDFLGADCFSVKLPKIGSARVIAYDMRAIRLALSMCEKEQITQPIFYILGNTIGGLIASYARRIHAAGGRLFINPDGLEWRRTKWSAPVRRYLKYAEKQMAHQADLIVSDNKGIQDYLTAAYGKINSQVIAYGTETVSTDLASSPTLEKLGITDYYLIVGRFVPENNYETLLRAFMASETTRNLVIITDYQSSSFYDKLRQKTGFDKDKRIRFVGTVYEQNELRYIREHAFAYLHGHEVGGTNPGLLEAMWSSPLNLVINVSFNREVAGDSALYFDKSNVSEALARAESLSEEERMALHQRAQAIIKERYTWDKIVAQYEELFLES